MHVGLMRGIGIVLTTALVVGVGETGREAWQTRDQGRITAALILAVVAVVCMLVVLTQPM